MHMNIFIFNYFNKQAHNRKKMPALSDLIYKLTSKKNQMEFLETILLNIKNTEGFVQNVNLLINNSLPNFNSM